MIGLIRRLSCSHPGMYLETRQGVRCYVCPKCPHTAPVLTREPQFHRGGKLPVVITREPKVAATVTNIQTFQQRVR